jgi:hypothetical protein
MGGGERGKLGFSQYWGKGGYPNDVAVHDGHNGIMTFRIESLRAEKRSAGELLYRFVCTKPINRTFDQFRSALL